MANTWMMRSIQLSLNSAARVPSGMAMTRGQHRRHDRHLHRQLQPGGNLGHHRPAGPHGDAEVADEDAGHPVDELPPHGLVEPEPGALGIDGGLAHLAAFGEQAQLHHVAGHQAQQDEDQHRHAEQRRDHQQDAVYRVAEHRGQPGKGPREPGGPPGRPESSCYWSSQTS
jgi:hypothetical protein